jgi:hypothetical protein
LFSVAQQRLNREPLAGGWEAGCEHGAKDASRP